MISSFFIVDATVMKEKSVEQIIVPQDITELRGIYISYLEFYDNFYGGSKSINEKKIDNMIDNISMSGFNTIFLHVSPFSDSIYPSKIFPYSATLTGVEGKNPGFDYLAYFLLKAHQKNIKIHAWINPYRISFTSDTSKLSMENPAYKLLNTSSVYANKNGIYYNPSSEIVKDLILKQVEEIINQYDVDGIHFDDYFYMQQDIDKVEYEKYLESHDITLKEFRLMHTSDLIKRIYKLIKEKNKKIIFSIAPDGSINNNYLYHYADVKYWLANKDYVDIIMPQIYYGFDNQYAPFKNTLDNWISLVTNDEIKIVPVLAFYKLGIEDREAGTGKMEWINDEDVIIRQIEYVKEKELFGYTMFRYDYLFNEEIRNRKAVNELEKLKNIIKKVV